MTLYILAHMPYFRRPSHISLLMGANHYRDVVEDHIIRGNGPTAKRSKLGYLLSGPMSSATPQSTSIAFHVSAQQSPDLQQFWSIESLGISPPDESTNTFLEQYSANSIEQFLDGSYSARCCTLSMEGQSPLPSQQPLNICPLHQNSSS